MKQLVLLCGILVSSVSAWSASEIKGVDTKSNGDEFTAVYSVSEPISEKELEINYRPRSVEMVFGTARLKESKSIVRVEHPLVDRVYTANKDGKVFSRIIFKEGMVAKDFQGRVGFEVKDDKVFLKISNEKVFPVVTANLDEALDNEVAKILSQDMPEKVTPKTVVKPVAKKDIILKESEIPVLTKPEVKKEASKSPYARLILSFVIIVLFGAAMAMISRWWKKKTARSDDNNKIRMVTQHFLGPRKSLAIVRVAGETMLIGVTDHNINMIKSLSLLDDDSMDNIDPTKSFGDVLQAQDPAAVQAEDDEEDFSFKQIKDRISNRVKEMRPL
jgi:flagellar protein FliO/FliZ